MAVNRLFLLVTSFSAIAAYSYPTPPFIPTTCWRNGTFYNVGDSIPSDPCSTCSCQSSGQVSCIYENCPYVELGKDCVNSVPLACGCRHCAEGPNCNFICSCVSGVAPICRPNGCMYRGEFFPEGIFYPSPCLRCECDPHSNGVKCSLSDCLYKPLVCVDAIVKPGTCCHVCPNGPNCFAGNKKIPAGQDYNDGSRICRCPETNPNLHFGSVGPQAVCTLVGPLAPPSTTIP